MNKLDHVRKTRMQALATGEAVKDFRLSLPKNADGSASADKAHMYIYDVIDDWFGVTASDVVQALMSFDGMDVIVHLNSPGGSVTEGLAIYNTIKNYEGDVEVRVEGIAASAASFIAMAGNKIVMEPNAMMMIHDAWDITAGNEAEHLKAADILGKASNNLADIYRRKAGGTTDEWRTRMRDETWYVGQEAVDASLADEVGGSSSDAQNRWGNFVPQTTGAQNRVAAVATKKDEGPAVPSYDFAGLLEGLKGVLA